MLETTITTGTTTSFPLTETHIPIGIGIQILNIIFMIGIFRGAILLLKDAKHHKRFAKIIRRIIGISLFTTLIGSIIIISLIYTKSIITEKSIGTLILIMASIGLLYIVTNIRGSILLLIESTKKKKFEKWIRIICGTLMIGSLVLGIFANI